MMKIIMIDDKIDDEIYCMCMMLLMIDDMIDDCMCKIIMIDEWRW